MRFTTSLVTGESFISLSLSRAGVRQSSCSSPPVSRELGFCHTGTWRSQTGMRARGRLWLRTTQK